MRMVQLYDVVRTAHLERAAASPGTEILYRVRRYDFDADAASKVISRRCSVFGLAWYALRHHIDVLEVNEPLVENAAPRAAVVIAFARLRNAVTRKPRTRVVSYAIANLAPGETVANLPFKARVRFLLQWPFVGLVWRGVDRIAFGTREAAELYEAHFGRRRWQPEAQVIDPLPNASGAPVAARGSSLIFLGDLSVRKGFPDLLDAWPRIRAEVPNATLTIVGRGEGSGEALALAAADERVSAHIDPRRDEIFTHLDQAKVLVLPSRRRPLWKEQIGLPILEGLSRGCLIVTSSETGISAWLDAHGHWTVDEPRVGAELTDALVAALSSNREPQSVLDDLPNIDGREAARHWMLAGVELSGHVSKGLPVQR